jgi:ABC-type Fe3+ transport system permease subunit
MVTAGLVVIFIGVMLLTLNIEYVKSLTKDERKKAMWEEIISSIFLTPISSFGLLFSILIIVIGIFLLFL